MYHLCIGYCHFKNILNGKIDTPWRNVLCLNENVRPEWRALYKSPLPKKTELQWKILHGIIAVNAFVSVINQEVNHKCPFCFNRETVFHVFMFCTRLRTLFDVLQVPFNSFGETFSMEFFIFGFKYTRKRCNECQLINFVLGQAKRAIYLSRKNKVENNSDVNLTLMFKILVKSRILTDYWYY